MRLQGLLRCHGGCSRAASTPGAAATLLGSLPPREAAYTRRRVGGKLFCSKHVPGMHATITPNPCCLQLASQALAFPNLHGKPKSPTAGSPNPTCRPPTRTVRYGVTDVPPWWMCILLGFQTYLTMLGATVLIPILLVPAMGGDTEGTGSC